MFRNWLHYVRFEKDRDTLAYLAKVWKIFCNFIALDILQATLGLGAYCKQVYVIFESSIQADIGIIQKYLHSYNFKNCKTISEVKRSLLKNKVRNIKVFF